LCPGCGNVAKAKTFDANGNVASRRDFSNNLTCYQFDPARNLEMVRVEGLAPSVTSCPSNLSTYTPAANTRQRKITTTWHANFRLPTSITELNRTTSLTYDASGNVLSRTITDTSVTPNVARTWTYTWDSYGRMLSENGPRTDVSDVTTYSYYTCSTGYHCGQVQTVTNALNQVTTYNSYNAHGQVTQITDPNLIVTTLAYDLRQRLTARCVNGYLPTCSGGELTQLEYWPTGLLKKATNPDGSFVQYNYDAAHRLTELVDGLGNKVVYTLDAMGNRTAENVYDPSLVLTRTRSQVFNSLNQLWKQIGAAGTANVTTVLGYDNNGNQTTTNAPLGRNSTQQYDELNRLKQITDPASGNTVFAYDAHDNLTSVKDPRNLTTSYQYTGFGDIKKITSPDTGITTNTYDSGGNLQTSKDARNAIATYIYDSLNRVQSVAFKKGTTTDQSISYSYDTGLNGLGRLTGASDASHSMSWGYDAQGRVTSKTQTIGTSVRTVGYGYTNGNLTSMTTPSGKLVTYGYANGQVTSIAVDGTTILNNVLYDAFGPARRWTWGNATQSIRTFDTDGKIQQIDSAGFSSYGYDDAFRITSITDTTVPANSWSYGYDSLDRLNSASKTGTTIGYTYDANGNRLTQTGTSASSYAIAATSNRLTATTGALVRTHTYDTAGNTLTTGATIHTYNNRGRMKTGRLSSTSTNTSYVYNALGQRVKKSGGTPGSVIFAYDEAGHLIGEYSATGTLVQETIWLGDIPVATLRPKTGGYDIFYVHTDHLNTPRRVTRPSDNKLRWRWDPTPFGEGAPNENPQALGVFKYHLRFPGQYFDIETNLAYNYFRDYDSAIGRYVESDPIGLKGGISTFGYAKQSPIMWFDPDGRCACSGGVWDQDRGDVSFSLALGGYIGGGRIYLTCRSNPSVKCSIHMFCIGGGPIIGGGLVWNLYGVVRDAPSSQNLTGWTEWQVTGSVPIVSGQAPTPSSGSGGSVAAGINAGAGLAGIKCNMTSPVCQCKDCKK
ncbi:MAG TPA: RHS repeat-associated core domain-containing protein, partial [Steroidobacteraceae bacterium]|nr:RHS repeat-associated core domain-containing protein [Steroidobacteraceae bacterium]